MLFKKGFWFTVISRWGLAAVLVVLFLGSLVPTYQILAADDPLPPDGGVPGVNTSLDLPNPIQCDDVFCVIGRILRGLRLVAVPVSVVMVVVGGYQIMAAGGDPEKFSRGRKTIIYAAVGLAVIILAEAVFYIVSDVIGGSGGGGGGYQCVPSQCQGPCPAGQQMGCVNNNCTCVPI